jgi:hypothetical protein
MNMNTHGNVDEVLRRYLLGQLAPEALDSIEGRVFSDDRIFWERLCLAEEELADDYAWGRLEGEEKASFERNFLCSDERRAKLEFARALKECVERKQPGRDRLWQWLRVPVAVPGWAMAVAAVLLLAVVPGIAWRFAVSQAPRDVVGAWLSPGQMRDISQSLVRLDIGAGCQLVRLPLETVARGDFRYSATVFDVTDGETEVWSQHQLSAGVVAGKQGVVLTVPCDLLREGDYVVRLEAVGPGSDPQALGRYSFRVRRQ